jgi:Family of unknown function (DUF6220)
VFTHIMRWLYMVSAWLILVVVIVQFFLAGLGVFAGDFQMHVELGYTIFFLMLLVLVIALAARLPWKTIGITALLPVLVFLQSIFIEAWNNGMAYIAALHVVNGLAIFTLAGILAVRSRAFLSVAKSGATKVARRLS